MVFLLFHDVYASDPRDSGFRSPAADRYKLSVARFERELASLGAAGVKRLPFALTFDDGGQSFYSIVADRLEAHGLRGYCFVATDFIDRRGFLTRDQLRELHGRGHRIGSHTASHPARFHACGPTAIAAEWRTSIDVLRDVLGAPVTTASVPGGWYAPEVAEHAAHAGITTLFTSEPVRSSHSIGSCRIEGRFTIRQRSAPGLAGRLVRPLPWSRWGMWAQWNAKGAVKPLLGPYYTRVADWLMAQHASEP